MFTSPHQVLHIISICCSCHQRVFQIVITLVNVIAKGLPLNGLAVLRKRYILLFIGYFPEVPELYSVSYTRVTT